MTLLRFPFQASRKFSNFLSISPNVQCALKEGSGVVALESTVITHGLPYPNNVETARALEAEVVKSGSTPATIALINGKIHVGLTDSQLEHIANDKNVSKVSTRDIAKTLVQKQIGGTTVAATMRIAHKAGIKVFATGGIGGVHRGAESTFDISADLQELSRTPVTVVCSGVKSILDIPKTVEYLETNSVNCIVYGTENVFPSFFTRKSESKGQFNSENLEEISKIIETSSQLGLQAGTILACPIPENYAADASIIQKAIDKALEEVSEKSIASQKVTPYILARVNQLTQGASMKTNIALLRNNASIAGRLASIMTSRRHYSTGKSKPKVLSVGAAILDYEAITSEDVKNDGGSYHGNMVRRCGGVARNHAEALARLGCHSTLLTAFGTDENASFLQADYPHIDYSRSEIFNDVPTAYYLAINVRGNVKYGIGSIAPILEKVTPEVIRRNEDLIKESDLVLLDGNMSHQVVAEVVKLAGKYDVKVWYEPTDIKKVQKAFGDVETNRISITSPNFEEFKQWSLLSGADYPESYGAVPEQVADFISRNDKVLHNLDILIVTLAENGSVVVSREGNGNTIKLLKAPIDPSEVVSVSGAGDSFNSGVITGLLHNFPLDKALGLGMTCAALTLQTHHAVSQEINEELIL